MRDFRNRARFTKPAPTDVKTGVGAKSTCDDLECDWTIRSCLDSPVDGAHGALAQLRLDLKSRDLREPLGLGQVNRRFWVSLRKPLQYRSAFRAALDMVLDRGVRPITE